LTAIRRNLSGWYQFQGAQMLPTQAEQAGESEAKQQSPANSSVIIQTAIASGKQQSISWSRFLHLQTVASRTAQQPPAQRI